MTESRSIKLNRPQALVHIVNPFICYLLWARGAGKTNGAAGPRCVHLINIMPGAQIGLIVPSYVMAFKQIIPNLEGYWQNEIGLVEGEDYVMCRKPPADWPKPYIPIKDYKYVITFDNGTVIPILSLEVEGAGNGFNLQAVVGDEAKFFNKKKLQEIIRAIRGGKDRYGHLAEFQSQWYFTDKLGGDIEWMLAKRKQMDPQKIAAVVTMQNEVNRLMDLPEDEYDHNTAALIDQYNEILLKARKNLIFVSEAATEENREILGDEYFKNQKENSTKLEYDIAIGNQDPSKVENSFYPDLGEQHIYNLTNDVDTTQPLIFAADYQWKISPIGIAQYGRLPNSVATTFNLVYSTDVLHPLGLVEAIDKFSKHFEHHQERTLYYLFDKTAVGKSSTSKAYYEVVMDRLKQHGWNVVEAYMGEPPLHDTKFKEIGRFLKGTDPDTPAIRINGLTNEHMLTSINLTPAITKYGAIAKDKSSEKNDAIPARKATHYSDVFDMLAHGCLQMQLVPVGGSVSSGGMGSLLL